MRYFNLLLFALLLLIGQQGICQTTEEEAGSDWSFGVSSGFSNKYMWRGIVYNNGLVLQPEAYIGYKDFSFSVWSNTTLYDVDGVTAHEIDYTLDYSHAAEKFEVETYLSYYQYIQQVDAPNTAEWYLKGSLPLGNFSVYSSLTVDVLEYAGASFLELGLNYEKELTEKLTLAAGCLTAFGGKKFNVNYLDIEKSAFNHVGGLVGLSYSLSENLTLEANFYQNVYVDSDVIQALGSNSNAVDLKLSFDF
jgi:hypothetical protein